MSLTRAHAGSTQAFEGGGDFSRSRALSNTAKIKKPRNFRGGGFTSVLKCSINSMIVTGVCRLEIDFPLKDQDFVCLFGFEFNPKRVFLPRPRSSRAHFFPRLLDFVRSGRPTVFFGAPDQHRKIKRKQEKSIKPYLRNSFFENTFFWTK